MFTVLGYVVALLVVGGLLFLAASFAFGRGEEMAPVLPEGTPVELPDDRPADGDDLRALRLSVAVRGYRMDEVDWLLDRLAEQVDSRDREIARLRSVLHVEPVPVPQEPELLTHPVPAVVDLGARADAGERAGPGATAVRTGQRPERPTGADPAGNAHAGDARDGDARDGGAHHGGDRDGGAHDGGAHDGEDRDGGDHHGGDRDGGAHDGGAHDGGAHDGEGSPGGGPADDRDGTAAGGPAAGSRPRPVRAPAPRNPAARPAKGDPTRGLRPDGPADSR